MKERPESQYKVQMIQQAKEWAAQQGYPDPDFEALPSPKGDSYEVKLFTRSGRLIGTLHFYIDANGLHLTTPEKK